jgi:Zn-dependent protease
MDILGWIFAFITAITVHEAAHAWMADRLGDPTARLMGRLSLNPIVHYDPVGTTLLLVLVFMRAIGLPVIPFGWAKPVRFDPYNLENPRRDSALISLAGPASNLILAAILSLLLHFAVGPVGGVSIFAAILIPTITLNVVLAIFNLVPIHPLDGGKIFVGLLPEKDAREADLFLHRYGILILFFLIFPTFSGTSPLFAVILPIISFLLNILIPGNPIV